MNFFERYDRLVLTLLAKYGHPDFFDAGFFSSITLEFLYKEKRKQKISTTKSLILAQDER